MNLAVGAGKQNKTTDNILIQSCLLSSAQTVEWGRCVGKWPTLPSCPGGDAQRVAEQLWTWPLCPAKGQRVSKHNLCSPLLLHPFTVHCVWGARLCCLVCCWLSDLVSSQQAGPPFVCCACARRRKDVFCTKAAGEHWKKSQMCSKSQSCHGKRAKVPESQKFWQPWRQCAQLGPKLIFCHNQCLY